MGVAAATAGVPQALVIDIHAGIEQIKSSTVMEYRL